MAREDFATLSGCGADEPRGSMV